MNNNINQKQNQVIEVMIRKSILKLEIKLKK